MPLAWHSWSTRPQRQQPRPGIDGLGLHRCEEADGLARVVEDEVLEVLVVAHGSMLTRVGRNATAVAPFGDRRTLFVVGEVRGQSLGVDLQLIDAHAVGQARAGDEEADPRGFHRIEVVAVADRRARRANVAVHHFAHRGPVGIRRELVGIVDRRDLERVAAQAALGESPGVVAPEGNAAHRVLSAQVDPGKSGGPGVADPQVAEQIEIEARYAGYLGRQREDIERRQRHEGMAISAEFDYARVRGLSTEVREKLERARPDTLGQASRIPGMTPAALSLLLVHLKRTRQQVA